MFLESIGADAVVFGALQSYAAAGLELGRVAVSYGDRYHLYTESGELEAEPSGSLWYRTEDRAAMPVTGDWVAARKVGPDQAIVDAVLPRRTCFSRRAAGTSEEQQPVAANIDLVFLVCGLDGDFNLRRLERYLALAVESGVQPVVVLNKSDLCAETDAARAQAAGVAGTAPVVICSARETDGIDALRSFLRPGRTVALLGSSGVGKSTIVNRLLGEERMRTREVRLSDSRGRHTTTHRELTAARCRRSADRYARHARSAALGRRGERGTGLWRRHFPGAELPLPGLLAHGGAGMRRSGGAGRGDTGSRALAKLPQAAR